MQAGFAPVSEVSADKTINNIKAAILTVVFMVSPFGKLFVTQVWYYSGWLRNRPRYCSWAGKLFKVATRAAWSFCPGMATIRFRFLHYCDKNQGCRLNMHSKASHCWPSIDSDHQGSRISRKLHSIEIFLPKMSKLQAPYELGEPLCIIESLKFFALVVPRYSFR